MGTSCHAFNVLVISIEREIFKKFTAGILIIKKRILVYINGEIE